MSMKKYIVSDLHGAGDVYDSIMGYLENVSLKEPVELYINGDLIDRGLDSFRMLLDVMERVKNPESIRIHFLGGNHELMMYQALKKRKPGKSVFPWCDWMLNGGWVIEGELDAHEDGERLCDECRDFLADLSIYHLFDEKVATQPLLLVHAQAPKEFKPMKIGDNSIPVFKAVWTRKKDEFGLPHRIGKEGFFTIIGHTPVLNKRGFEFCSKENYLNIDGGCAGYALGMFEYQYVPLVEVENGRVKILVFNHNNEIVKGYLFDGEFSLMSEEELSDRRGLLNHQFDAQEEDYKKKILEIVNL